MEKSTIDTKFKFSVYKYLKFVNDNNCKINNTQIFTIDEMIECWDEYFINKKIE